MPKGYWIAHIDVTNPDRYRDYVAANAIAFGKYDAKFLVRGGPSTMVAGNIDGRHVIVEFPSLQAAKDCYESPEYRAAMEIRNEASTPQAIIIIEGYDGPQPGE